MIQATVLQMPIKTKLVCSECGAAGEGSCRCGAPYVAPGERAEAYVKAHPEMSDRAIAEEISVGKDTVRRIRQKTTGACAPVEKRTGKDGKSRKLPRSRPIESTARGAVRHKVIAGERISRQKIQGEFGVGEASVQRAVAAERARLEVLNELGVDPETLAPSAKAKLEIAKRQLQHKFEIQFVSRMRNLDEEVRQRVLKEGKAYLATLKEMEDKAYETEKFYRDMTNNRKPILTVDEYNLLRKCLHQGGIAATTKDFDAAFDLIQKKKLQLTGQK